MPSRLSSGHVEVVDDSPEREDELRRAPEARAGGARGDSTAGKRKPETAAQDAASVASSK